MTKKSSDTNEARERIRIATEDAMKLVKDAAAENIKTLANAAAEALKVTSVKNADDHDLLIELKTLFLSLQADVKKAAERDNSVEARMVSIQVFALLEERVKALAADQAECRRTSATKEDLNFVRNILIGSMIVTVFLSIAIGLVSKLFN